MITIALIIAWLLGFVAPWYIYILGIGFDMSQ